LRRWAAHQRAWSLFTSSAPSLPCSFSKASRTEYLTTVAGSKASNIRGTPSLRHAE
jgi:hypothetical protein